MIGKIFDLRFLTNLHVLRPPESESAIISIVCACVRVYVRTYVRTCVCVWARARARVRARVCEHHHVYTV